VPKIKLLDNPAVADLVAKREAKAADIATKDAIRAVRAVTKDTLASLDDEGHINMIKNHSSAILSIVRGKNAVASTPTRKILAPA
jgi:predicted transcriptional regulator